MFNRPMHIEKSVAKIEHAGAGYRIVLTVEKEQSEAITQEEVEIHLTKTVPYLFTQRLTFGR